MFAKLGIYKDCASVEPTKVHECRRLLYGVSKKALSLAERAEGKTQEEQEAILVELLQAIFPEFKPEELDFVDPVELESLILSLRGDSAAEVARVEKN